MTSPRGHSTDLARFYTVTEPQRHPRGYTVYKVTARVSAGGEWDWRRPMAGQALEMEIRKAGAVAECGVPGSPGVAGGAVPILGWSSAGMFLN
jgi:hypothetical protein